MAKPKSAEPKVDEPKVDEPNTAADLEVTQEVTLTTDVVTVDPSQFQEVVLGSAVAEPLPDTFTRVDF